MSLPPVSVITNFYSCTTAPQQAILVMLQHHSLAAGFLPGEGLEEGRLKMIFRQDNSLKVALFVPKDTVPDATLRREEARTMALREMEQAGVSSREQIEIEAYENRDGWMIFASASLGNSHEALWFRFDCYDDFLDAYAPLAAYRLSLSGWGMPGGGFALRLTGPGDRLRAACTYLKEFATPFEAPEWLGLHLAEQGS